MSAAVPYIAPWQTGFERFSTEVKTCDLLFSGQTGLIIPVGQFWRLIFVKITLITSAVAGNRTAILDIRDDTGTLITVLGTPLITPASRTTRITWGPGLNAFANTTDPNFQFAQAPVPDVLWPQNTQFELLATPAFAGDTVATNTAFIAAEVYIAESREELAAQPTLVLL